MITGKLKFPVCPFISAPRRAAPNVGTREYIVKEKLIELRRLFAH